MQQCLQKLPMYISQIFQYSGHYVMRVGNYQECINTQGMDYYSIYFNQLGNLIAMMYVGVCLPKECTVQGLTTVINGLAQAAGYDIRVSFINNRIWDKKAQFDWVFWLTIVIIAVLLISVLLATCSKKVRSLSIIQPFALQNSTKIFKYNPKSNLNILNGVRSLSMFYVILGHQYSLVIINTSNILSINQLLYQWPQLLIQSGILAVDTFFFVGGFLVSYSILKQTKIKSKLRYPLAIINRFLRFLPSYLLAILIYYSIMVHFVQGPFWFQNLGQVEKCKGMWKSLLYVDNFVDNGNSMCMGWGWYLQNDMQMFLVSLLLLLIYNKDRFWGFITIFITVCSSFWFTMQSTYSNQYKYTTHMADFFKYGDYMSDIYIKPYSRCPPYFYGLLLGMLYVQFLVSEKQQNKEHINSDANKISMDEVDSQDKHHQKHVFVSLKQYLMDNPWKRRVMEIMGLGIMTFVVLIPRTAQGDDYFWPQLAHSFFLTYSKFIFIFGLSLTVLPSLLGIHTLARFMLDTKAFNFIAKISFWTYLIHLNVINIGVTSIKIDFYYAYVPLFSQFVCSSILSMALGLVFCLICEVPFAGLQKIFMNWIMGYFGKNKMKEMEGEGNKNKRNSNEHNEQQAQRQTISKEQKDINRSLVNTSH